MKEHWLKIKEWWVPLAPREKIAIAAGTSVVVLFLLYQFIWSPFLDQIIVLRKRIVTEQKTLVWMQAADKQLSQLEAQSPAKVKIISPVVLLSAAKKYVNQAGLTQNLILLKQINNDTVELHFQKINFDQLMTLLIKIIKEQHITLTRLSVTRDNVAGMVEAEVVLKT